MGVGFETACEVRPYEQPSSGSPGAWRGIYGNGPGEGRGESCIRPSLNPTAFGVTPPDFTFADVSRGLVVGFLEKSPIKHLAAGGIKEFIFYS